MELPAISKPSASASVSAYSRTFVTLLFRTLKAMTQLFSNVLFVALTLSLLKPTIRTRSHCANEFAGLKE